MFTLDCILFWYTSTLLSRFIPNVKAAQSLIMSSYWPNNHSHEVNMRSWWGFAQVWYFFTVQIGNNVLNDLMCWVFFSTVLISNEVLNGLMCRMVAINYQLTTGERAVGSFEHDGTHRLTEMQCPQGKTITHAGRLDSNRVSFNWLAPKDLRGDIFLR